MADEKDDVVTRARKNQQRAQDHWAPIYSMARSDLHFLSDDPFAQWTERDYNDRVNSGRPALTIDQLSQFVHQVSNDIRQNTPTLTVIPDGQEASDDAAEVFKGLIRNIEYISNADDVYDTAANNSVKSSIGFIRIDHEYCCDETDEQQLVIKRVINPLACWIDPDSIECDGRDAKFGFVVDRITKKDFKRLYPGKEVSSFEVDGIDAAKLSDEDHIQVAEYFEIEETERQGNGTRILTTRKVMRYKLSGKDVLEKTSFPGKYIPLVPVYGEEAWIEGKRHLFSLIRKSKGAQMMYNVWKSLETEIIMKQPQAPVMVAEGQIEEYMDDWKNPSKSMALRYKPLNIDGVPIGAPQRLAPPGVPAGIVNASRETVDDIKATMGLYNASIGQRSNETSGVAINQRKQEGDVATFHFYDNLVRSITHVYRLLVEAIPEIYDTGRIIRTIGVEDEPKQVGINGMKAEGQEEVVDLSKGKYTVRVVPGASYTTKRQEAQAFYSEIAVKQPELIGVMGDLLFANADFAGAEAMSERMKKVIEQTHPGLIDPEDGEAPDPQVIALQQQLEQAKAIMQQGQQEIQDLQMQVKDKTADIQVKEQTLQAKAMETQSKNELESMKLQNEQLKAQMDIQKSMRELELKEAELAIKERDIAIKEQSLLLQGQELQLQQYEIDQRPQLQAQAHQENMESQLLAAHLAPEPQIGNHPDTE